MKYCSDCGESVSHRVPEEDNRLRYVCDSCDTIHYQNPRIVAGCIATHGDSILLCKRAIHPRRGFWTLPAGYMENGETTQQGAQRETWEEAEAEVEKLELYTLFNLPHINQVYMFFRAEVIEGKFGNGSESLETKLVKENEIPWDELAFPTVRRTIELFFEDVKSQSFPVRIEDIHFPPI